MPAWTLPAGRISNTSRQPPRKPRTTRRRLPYAGLSCKHTTVPGRGGHAHGHTMIESRGRPERRDQAPWAFSPESCEHSSDKGPKLTESSLSDADPPHPPAPPPGPGTPLRSRVYGADKGAVKKTFREREDWRPAPSAARTASGDTAAGIGPTAGRPVKPESRERDRVPQEA